MSGSWKMSLGKLYMEQAGGLGPSKRTQPYHVATHELQDDRLSVRKATKPCKTHGFFTLGVLHSGLTAPRLPNMLQKKRRKSHQWFQEEKN